jgi:predicted CXXCH cytochrome family protein
VLIAAGVAVLLMAFSAAAQRSGKYTGTKVCVMCHADTHAAIVAAHGKTAHHSAMSDIAKSPEAAVGDFASGCPFNKADVAYVLGTGKAYQNYLDKDLKVLPGRWDAIAKKWANADAVDGATQCVGCHVTNFDPAAKTWTELGVGCESCHGPGGAHADSMEAKDINSLKKLDAKKLNMVCGQCHASGTDLSGKHAFSTTFVPGDDLEKHFKIGTPAAGAQNSQYNTFLTSKHNDGIMKCTTCHEPHGDKTKGPHQLRKPVNDLCLGCHSMDLGAVKAIESVAVHAPTAKPDDTCATCHMVNSSHTFVAKK